MRGGNIGRYMKMKSYQIRKEDIQERKISQEGKVRYCRGKKDRKFSKVARQMEIKKKVSERKRKRMDRDKTGKEKK